MAVKNRPRTAAAGLSSPVHPGVWLAMHKIRPRVIGEFDDAALMKAFGSEGRGIFMTPTVLESETSAQYGVRVVGRTSELIEEFYAVTVERRISHPCVAAITDAAREQLSGS